MSRAFGLFFIYQKGDDRMTEAYRFFGGAVGDPRQYVQTEFAEVLERVFRNGYFPGLNSELQVAVTDPERMAVRVASGQAWINGYYYKNDGWKEIELEPAHADNDRIDRIVLRLDTINERSIVSEVKTGTPSSSPSAPGLDRDDQLWALRLATVRVRAGSSSVSNSNITDTRGDSDLCGKAIARLTPADINAATQQSLDTHIDDEDNPHRVTKSQVGLSDVDNVKQATKSEFDSHVGADSLHINRMPENSVDNDTPITSFKNGLNYTRLNDHEDGGFPFGYGSLETIRMTSTTGNQVLRTTTQGSWTLFRSTSGGDWGDWIGIRGDNGSLQQWDGSGWRTLANASDLDDYVKTAVLNDYVKTSTLNNYAKKDAANTFDKRQTFEEGIDLGGSVVRQNPDSGREIVEFRSGGTGLAAGAGVNMYGNNDSTGSAGGVRVYTGGETRVYIDVDGNIEIRGNIDAAGFDLIAKAIELSGNLVLGGRIRGSAIETGEDQIIYQREDLLVLGNRSTQLRLESKPDDPVIVSIGNAVVDMWTGHNNPLSKGTNGYQRFGSDFILQWGRLTGVESKSQVTATFPITFPTNCMGVFTTMEGPNANYDSSTVVCVSRNPGSAVFRYGSTSSVTRDLYYLAVGY